MKERFFLEVKDIPQREDVKLLEFKGEIDITNSHYVIHRVFSLINNGYKYLIADFGKLEHINSSGIFNLLRCYAKLQENGGWMKFIHLEEPLFSVLRSLGITRVFSVYKDLEEALKDS